MGGGLESYIFTHFFENVFILVQSCSEYNFHLCLHFIIMLKYRVSCGMCVNLLPLIPFLPWLPAVPVVCLHSSALDL